MATLDWLLGRPLSSDEDEEQRVGVPAGLSIFGLDALGSAAYGPEAALTVLIPLGAAGVAYVLPLSLIIILLLSIVFFSYRQTIDAYPNSGGSYTVATENLGTGAGLLAAAALMLDYLLDVAVGISTGVGALVSAVSSLERHTLLICLGILLLLAIINLRGVRQAGAIFTAPTYVFIFSLLGMIVWGVGKAFISGGHPTALIPPPSPAHAATAASAWLLIRAFAGGCTALTGVEAVSNGVRTFREPSTQTAKRTLTLIVALLAIFLAGIAYLVRVYGITATPPGGDNYQSLLSMLAAAVAGRGAFYYITIGSILVVLSLSANTAFADFPRLCRAIAENGYLPRFFAIRGRRLVYTEGIVALAVLAGVLLIVFGGVTDRLIPLFAIGAFLAFTLSQAGMVGHWRRKEKRISHNLLINAVGASATGATVIIVLIAKFAQGAWITVLLVPSFVILMVAVHRHYVRVERQTRVASVTLNPPSPPLAVVPVSRWDRASQGALRFACALTKDVQVLHIECAEEHGEETSDGWQRELDRAAKHAAILPPRVVTLASPYRFITAPILHYVLKLEREHPDRQIAVVIPELVERRWYLYLLHNHRSTALKARLLFEGNRRIVVINVPWYLSA